MQTPSIWISGLIVGGSALMLIIVGAGLHRSAGTPELTGRHRAAARGVGALLAFWLLLATALAANGYFLPGPTTRLPRVGYALIPLILGYGLFRNWPALRQVVERTRPSWLIGVQLYRLLGAVFIAGYIQGLLPGVFALPAGIGDILIGLLAPIVAGLVAAKHPWARRCAMLWNMAGIADLAMAVTLGILSAPGPLHHLSLDAPNSAISAFPFVLIPTVLVPLSILLHLFSLHTLGKVRPGSSKSKCPDTMEKLSCAQIHA